MDFRVLYRDFQVPLFNTSATGHPWSSHSSHRTSNLCPYQTTAFNGVSYQLRFTHLRILLKNDFNVPVSKLLVGWEWGVILSSGWTLQSRPSTHLRPEVHGRLVRLNVIVVNLANGSPGWLGFLPIPLGLPYRFLCRLFSFFSRFKLGFDSAFSTVFLGCVSSSCHRRSHRRRRLTGFSRLIARN